VLKNSKAEHAWLLAVNVKGIVGMSQENETFRLAVMEKHIRIRPPQKPFGLAKPGCPKHAWPDLLL